MQIQKIECVLKDTIRIKKKEIILIVYSFTPSHRRKNGRVPAAFWPLFKNVSFEFSNYKSFAAFILPRHSSDGNFRPFWAFMDFLQMFKFEKFAS